MRFDKIKAKSDSLPTDAERLKYLADEKARLEQERPAFTEVTAAQGRLHRETGKPIYLRPLGRYTDRVLDINFRHYENSRRLLDSEIERVRVHIEAEASQKREAHASRKKASAKGGSQSKIRAGIFQHVKSLLTKAPALTHQAIFNLFPESADAETVQVGETKWDIYRDGDQLVQEIRNGGKKRLLQTLEIRSLDRYVERAKRELHLPPFNV